MEQLQAIAPMVIFLLLLIGGIWFFVRKRQHLTPERANIMQSGQIPQQIQNVLTRDEVLEKSFDLQDCRVYATSKRLLELKGRSTRDFHYAHISSIAYLSKRYWWLIAIGVIFAIGGIIMGRLLDEMAIGMIAIVPGVILILVGALYKPEWVVLNVVGISEPHKFEGSKQTLDSLLQIIREKRDAQSAAGQAVTKAIDSIEAIRKLSELKDDGIITEEEFQDKKSKLLEDSG